jgi:hypothetical protein
VVGVSEDLIEQYLADLRASLRTPPERTAQILAEAEDHLRESAAAGLAVGMSEREAQEAAISALGTVRAVARANRRPSAALADLGMAACKAAGVYLLAIFAASFVVFFAVRQAVSGAPPGRYPFATPQGYAGPPALWASCGAAGLVLLCGYHIARRVRRHRLSEDMLGGFYPLVAVVSCVTLAVILAVLSRVTRVPQPRLPEALPGALAVAAERRSARPRRRARRTGPAEPLRVPVGGVP